MPSEMTREENQCQDRAGLNIDIDSEPCRNRAKDSATLRKAQRPGIRRGLRNL